MEIKKYIKTAPDRCEKAECFGYKAGYCNILSNTDFGNRECPFFKTREQIAKEKKAREARYARG